MRINRDNLHAREFGLVFDLRPQIKKRPAKALCSVYLPNRSPRVNALQFFNGDSALRVFGLPNDSFADLMVDVFGKPGFFQVAFLKQSLRALRPLALKFGAQFPVSLSHRLNLCATERLAITVGGNSSNAEVNAEEATRLAYRRFDHVDGGEQEPFALAKNQVSFALPVGKQSLLSRTTNKRHLLSAAQCPDRNAVRLVAQNSIIKSNRAVFMENALNFSIKFIGVGNLRNNPDGDLSRQSELLTDNSVAELVELELTEHLDFPCNTRAFIGGLIRSLKSFLERYSLLGGWF